MSNSVLLAVARRDLRLAGRRRAEALLPVGFFVVVIGLFPLGIGPEPQTLRQIAPGLSWVCALLATLLSVTQMFAADQQDGSLEQMLLSPQPLVLIVLGKVLAHWLLSGLPLVLLAPLVGVMLDMRAGAVATLGLTLMLGTPVLSLLGAVGSALTLGLHNGAALLFLLVLPLTIPALVFGSAAVAAADAGLSARPHLSLMAALLILTALTAPWAAAAALRIAVD